MREVVAGQAAVQLRKVSRDQVRLFALDCIDQPVNRADAVAALLNVLQLLVLDRPRGPDRTVQQHGRQFQHVVARLAVEAGTLTAGISADHAADRGAIGGREFRWKEQAVLGERGVELILHDASLHPHPALFRIDFEDAVHVP